MASNFPRVSVIVPTYKSWNTLLQCIEALERQSYPSEFFEIIVVNNHPEDAPPAGLQKISLLAEAVPGSYAARNKGLSKATGDIIAFTDADCIPDKYWLEEGVKAIVEKKADRIAGHIRVTFLGEQLSAVEAYQKALSFNQRRLADNGLSVTANFLCTRHAIDTVGLFNSDLLSGGDWDWNRRANRAGLNLFYSETAIVDHPARSTWADLLKKSRRVNSSNVKNTSLLISVPKIVIHFAKGFVPPIKRGIEIFGNTDLTAEEKIKSWAVCYLLKIYGHTVRFLTFFGFIKPSRA